MSELTITDQRLKPIADKVFAGERLSPAFNEKKWIAKAD